MWGWLQATLALVAAAIGVYGSLTKYASDTSAMYFVLTAAGIVVFFDKLPKIKDTLRPIYYALGAAFVAGVLAIGWFNGGLVRLAETVSCDLRLPWCQWSRTQRIAWDFAPLEFIGFNSRLDEGKLARAQGLCGRSERAIAFELTKTSEPALSVRYRVVSLLPDWRITGNEPVSETQCADPGAPCIDVGIMNASDRITRSPIRFPAGANGSVLVAVCVKPSSTGTFDGASFSPSGILNLTDIEVTPET
jgi:hypothetical protein